MNKKLSIKLSLKKASSQEQAQENEDDNREESVKDKSDPDYSDQPKTKRRKATRTPKSKKTLIVKFKYKSETSSNINTSNENRSAPENDTPADGIPTPNPSQYSKITEAATKDLSEDVTDTIPLSQLSGYNRKEYENNQGSRNRDHLNSPQDVSIENNTASVTPGANDSNKNVSTNPNLRKVTEISKVTAEDSTLDFSDDSAEIDALLDAIGNGTQANNPIGNVPYVATPNNGVNQISTNNGVNQTPSNQLEYQQFYNVRIPYEHTLNGQVRDGNVANLHANNPNNSAYNHLGFHNVGQVSNGYVSPFSVSGYTTGDPNSTQLSVGSSRHPAQYNAYNQQFPVPNHFVQQQQQQQQAGEADDDDDDLVESAVLISLLDPITSNRIRIPVRSRVCSHLDCFDLISFRELNRLSPFNVVSRNQASYIARPKVLALLDDAKRRPLNPQKYNTRTIDFNYRQKKKWNSENKKFNNALEFFCCPICNLEFSIKTPGDLYIIGEMLEILENLNKNSKVSKIELSLDGKWKYYMEKDANTKDTDVDAVNNLNLVEKDYELIDLESDEEAEADVLKVKKEANLSQSIPESEIEEKTEKETDDFFESIQAESNSGKGSACDPINLDDEDEEEEEEEEEVVENGDTVEITESEEVNEDQQTDKGGVSSEPEQDGTNGNKDSGAKTGLFSNAAKDLAGLGNGGSGLRADILQSANLLGRLIDEDYDEEEDEDYIYNPNNDNHDDDDEDDEDENGENYENGEDGENDAIENELSDLDVDDIVNLEKQVSANSQSQPSQPTQPSQQSQQQRSQQDNKQLPQQSDSVKKSSANNYNLTEEQLKIMERGRSIIGNGMQRIHQIAQETQRQQYIQQSQAQQRNQQYHQHHHQQHPQQQQYQQGPGYGNNSYNNMIDKVTQMVGSNGSTSSQRSNGYSVLPHVFNSYNNPGYHSRPYNFVVGNSNSNNSNNNSNTNPNSNNFGPVFFSGSGDADDPLVLDDDEDE
ncbi:hypothetical protein B5S33_g3591 [[Candida] boidinii]|nr:hypothetical protein B5S30_g3818 [[Candida] boidinii]OWB84934.1 hypothetical protein B5S33_g3591 [[Candida] boidinii]